MALYFVEQCDSALLAYVLGYFEYVDRDRTLVIQVFSQPNKFGESSNCMNLWSH